MAFELNFRGIVGKDLLALGRLVVDFYASTSVADCGTGGKAKTSVSPLWTRKVHFARY